MLYQEHEDNSIDTIDLQDQLMLVPNELLFSTIKNIYRICKPNAIINIKIPHYRHDNAYDNPGYYNRFTLEDFRLFSKTYNLWHIKTYNSSSGFGLKLDVDFEIENHQYFIEPEFEPILNAMPEREQFLFINKSYNVIKTLTLNWKVIK